MKERGPMDYFAKPEAMGRLISRVFEDRLFEHGIPYALVGLMVVQADDRAAELASMARRPAREALGVALGVMATAWDEAMTAHGMFRESIDGCQRKVRLEIEEIVDEHVTLIQERREAGSPHGGAQGACLGLQ